MFRANILFKTAMLSLAVFLFSSCESNSWFHSEDTLKAKIQKTWDMVRIPSSRPAEEWIFKEGRVDVYRDSANVLLHIDSGNYSISTTLTRAFLSMTDFKFTGPGTLNTTWEIIELDNGLLFIVTDYDGSTGLKQREFTER